MRWALLFLAACQPQPLRPVDLGPLPEPAALLQRLRDRAAGTRSLRASGRITYFGEQGRVRLRTVILAERPGKARLETISPLEQPLDVMATDGQRLWLLSNNQLHEGPATPENLARLIPLPLRPEDLVDVLLGGVPGADRFEPVRVDSVEDRWRLRLLGPNRELAQLWVHPDQDRVERWQLLDAAEAIQTEVRFDDFEPVPGRESGFPRSLTVKVPSRDLTVDIKLTQAELDVDLSPQLFRIDAPGVPVIPLDSPPVAIP